MCQRALQHVEKQGDHFEHNFGHCTQYLSSALAGLMLLAFSSTSSRSTPVACFSSPARAGTRGAISGERFRALFFTFHVPNGEALMGVWADPSLLQFTLPTPDAA